MIVDPFLIPIILIVLGAIIIVLVVWLIILEKRVQKLVRGKNGSSLEEVILSLIKEVERLHHKSDEEKDHRLILEQKLQSSIRGVSTVRFNPFKDSSGNQSFATAFVNQAGEGVVISTLFSRDRMSIFGKPVKDFGSEYDLSKEESKALEDAQKQIS